MKHATSRLLFAYWDALRRDRLAPERGEIEPGRIRHILADTFVLSADPAGSAAFRLAGTRCAALFGRDLREQPFDGLWRTAEREDARGIVAGVVSDMRGVVLGADGTSADGRRLSVEMLLLPLRHAGRERSRLIGSLTPATMPAWIGVAPVESLTTSSIRIIYGERASLPGERLFANQPQRRFVVHEGGRQGSDATL